MNKTYTLAVAQIPAKTWLERTQWRLLLALQICGHTVPRDFLTDGASVPRLFWWLFPPTGRYMAAAVLHDYLLHSGRNYIYSANQFLYAMHSMGVSRWRRVTIYSAVRAWGLAKSLWVKYV